MTLAHFRQLAEMVAATCRDERVLVIGFAETATAVGAAVAASLPGAVYCHTTRENLPGLIPAVEFMEAHSHAKNQTLYLLDEFRDLTQYDRLVFVEDEITTGRTILNFLEGTGYDGKLTVAALVFNGLEAGAFSGRQVDFCCVQKWDDVCRLEFPALPEPRSGVSAGEYQAKCVELARNIMQKIDPDDIFGKRIVVLGVEEFMYPAIVLGSLLEGSSSSVRTHSTTRSPIVPDARREYPLWTRTELSSPHDAGRTTYLYNLEKYDTAIVLADAPSDGQSLLDTLRMAGNDRIYYVRIGR
jgi:hypothetical protein